MAIFRLNKATSIFICYILTIACVQLTLSFSPSSCYQLRIPKKNLRREFTILKMVDSIPRALAQEGDWAAYLDEEGSGLVYYFNSETGESKWAPPTKTFPKLRLTQKQLNIMRQKTNSVKADVLEKKETGFSFGEIFRNMNEEEKVDKTKEVLDKSEKSSNFSFTDLFSFGDAEPKEEVVEKNTNDKKIKDESEKEKSNTFFSSVFSKMDTSPEQYDDKNAVDKVIQSKNTLDKVIQSEEETESFSTEKLNLAFSNTMAALKTKETSTSDSDTSSGMKLNVFSKVLPHPEKVAWGGEDTILCKGRTFGIFDGVSGAEKLEGLPLYSVTLAKQLNEIVGTKGLPIKKIIDCLQRAGDYASLTSTGASTALLASIREDGFLNALNLGDSTLLVIRDGSIVEKTKEIVHYFDCPYQLAEDSPDKPEYGTKLKVKLMAGDIVVMGSDGIFDNLSDQNVCEIVISTTPENIVQSIINESRKKSLDKTIKTPYSLQAKRNGYEGYEDGIGGKVDDISGIVVQCS